MTCTSERQKIEISMMTDYGNRIRTQKLYASFNNKYPERNIIRSIVSEIEKKNKKLNMFVIVMEEDVCP